MDVCLVLSVCVYRKRITSVDLNSTGQRVTSVDLDSTGYELSILSVILSPQATVNLSI